MSGRSHRFLPYAISAGFVAVVGLLAYGFTRLVPLPHVSVLFMAAVLTSAALWGFWPAVLAAVLSVATSMYFFYSPIFDFRVADVQDVADLGVFVIVAALTSRLAASVRAQALEARRQQRNVAGLLAFSERIAASASDAELHAAILEHLAPQLGEPIHLLLHREDGLRPAASRGGAVALPDEVLAVAGRVAQGADAAAPGWRIERLASAQGIAGVVVAPSAVAVEDPEYGRALLGQAALAVEREKLRREVAEARIRMHGEALREALINSVSHDLRTPLAAILGSATALETFGEHADARARSELVATVREEAERLQSYIDNVLDLTRIRAGRIAPRLELVELADIVDAALRRKQRALAAHRVSVELPPDLPMLRLDLFLMEHAFANILDNAAKYAPPGSPIAVLAARHDGEVVVDIVDAGRGMRSEDLPRAFEAFFRGQGVPGQPRTGTGLGLAICRAFVEANGGTAAISSAGPGTGTTVRLRLPVPAAPEGTVDEDE